MFLCFEELKESTWLPLEMSVHSCFNYYQHTCHSKKKKMSAIVISILGLLIITTTGPAAKSYSAEVYDKIMLLYFYYRTSDGAK
jgi:hypothetical protein